MKEERSFYDFPKEFVEFTKQDEFLTLPRYREISRLISEGCCEGICLLKRSVINDDALLKGDKSFNSFRRRRLMFLKALLGWFKSEREGWKRQIH